MPEAAETRFGVSAAPARTLSPRALGAIGLGDGLIALTIVALGSSSWMLLGAALVVWVLCGWAIFFRPRSRQPLINALGSILLLTAAVAALAVLSGLYLLALGPSWIL